MILAEFSMFPTDVGESKSKYVSQVIDHIDKSGIKYKLTPMSTILEGEWDEVMKIISECYKILEPQAKRIYTVIKIDARPEKTEMMNSKIESVKKRLGREINHT